MLGAVGSTTVLRTGIGIVVVVLKKNENSRPLVSIIYSIYYVFGNKIPIKQQHNNNNNNHNARYAALI